MSTCPSVLLEARAPNAYPQDHTQVQTNNNQHMLVWSCSCLPCIAAKEAAMGPIRDLPPSALTHIPATALRPIAIKDFALAMRIIKPSTDRAMLASYEEFTRAFGTGG